MTQRFRRGVLTVATLDRLDDLRRMLTSLWKHNKVQVQVMMARDWLGAHEIKSRMGAISTFDSTVFLDTDMYINGDIRELFTLAEDGRLAIYRHLTRGGGTGHWNSGVMAFNQELGLKLSAAWAPQRMYIAGQVSAQGLERSYYRTDQKSLNAIIDRFPIYSLNAKYNYIIPERSLEAEAKDWDHIRIFHFLHKACAWRESCRSWKEWMEL